MPGMSLLRTAPLRALLRRLARDRSGLAMIEMAYAAPFLMLLGLGGVEVANYAIIHMRVSQLAVSLADNASRAKQEVVSGVPRMREVDVNEAFTAAIVQAGQLDVAANGRLILSSLEVNDEGGQWIHWQRCFGEAPYASSYGEQGDGAEGTELAGMGPAGRQVQAETGYAIMFAEVSYEYQPIMLGDFIEDRRISKVAAMFVRDNRDLSQLFNPAPGAAVNDCD
nr:hypothetical protein WG33_0104 [uncultured bacterium]